MKLLITTEPPDKIMVKQNLISVYSAPSYEVSIRFRQSRINFLYSPFFCVSPRRCPDWFREQAEGVKRDEVELIRLDKVFDSSINNFLK